jgi:hypothetical protein
MAMAVNGYSRQHHDVKVKFIETQFISSDAASFKDVVQRLTGKSSSHAPAPPPSQQQQRPRSCRPVAGFASGDKDAGSQLQPGWWSHEQQAGNGHYLAAVSAAPKQEPPRLEELYELCDFGDLLYANSGVRRDGGFPY